MNACSPAGGLLGSDISDSYAPTIHGSEMELGDPRELRLDPAQVISVREHVYDGLRRAVLAGHFRTGEQLKERSLAEMLGVSTTPVKEALLQLQSEGLVRSEARRGVFITFGRKQAEEMILARASLERTITYLAAERATPSMHDVMAALVVRMSEATQAGDVDMLIESNAAFHEAIHRASGCAYLRQILLGQAVYDDLTRAELMRNPDERMLAFTEHAAIQRFIAERDATRAERAMYDHVVRSGRLYLDRKFGLTPDPV
jgi:DNA-binding GntR family transcriptional regulator